MLGLEGLQGPLPSGCVWLHSGNRERGKQEGNVICHPRLHKEPLGLLSEIPSLVLEGCQLTATHSYVLLATAFSLIHFQPAAVLKSFIQTVRGEVCLPSLCASGISSQTCSTWSPLGPDYLCQLLADKTDLSTSQCGQGTVLLAPSCKQVFNIHIYMHFWK